MSGHEVAIEELAYHWQYQPETLSILQQLAQRGNETAAIELALGWSNNPSILSILRDFINTYGSGNYRYLSLNNNQNNNVQIIIQTLSHLTNQSNNQEMDITQWLNRLANHNDIENMQEDLEKLKRQKKGIETGYFRELQTKLTDAECLVKALHSLGMTVTTDSDVRGSNGTTKRADVVAVLAGNFDIGWSKNNDGTFDLIADLWGVAKMHNQTELVNSIFQRYAAISKGYRRFVS